MGLWDYGIMQGIPIKCENLKIEVWTLVAKKDG
jgi:hypothetical protein